MNKNQMSDLIRPFLAEAGLVTPSEVTDSSLSVCFVSFSSDSAGSILQNVCIVINVDCFNEMMNNYRNQGRR